MDKTKETTSREFNTKSSGMFVVRIKAEHKDLLEEMAQQNNESVSQTARNIILEAINYKAK